MTDISFIDRLGDTLEETLGPKIAPRSHGRRRLPRWLSPRLAVALGVLVIGGGAATAATLIDQGATTLVAQGLTCISGTNNDGQTSASDVQQNGNSPTAACAPVIGVSASSLVACANSERGVVVYEANSDPAAQCSSLGLTPLPADYTTAVSQVHALEQALTASYDKADCTSPSQLAQDADTDLQQLGFTGWHAVIDTSSAAEAEFAGPCGEFPGHGATISSAAASLDASNHTVRIQIGAPRSSLTLVEQVIEPMLNGSGDQCYSLAGVQQFVRDSLNTAAGHTVTVKFAVTKEPPNTIAMGGSGSGPNADGRQTYYNDGCTILAGLGTAPDGTTFLAALENNTGRPAQNINGPGPTGPPSRFQSNLTTG